MPRRNDGLPNVDDHSIYSNRQRTIVLTFPSVESAKAFDRVDSLLIETAIYQAMTEAGWNA